MSDQQQNPWEQRGDESDVAFNAFSSFLKLGPGRSIDRAAAALRAPLADGASEKKRAPRNWSDWSVKYEWRVRALAYDRHLERLAQAGREAEHLELINSYTREVLIECKESLPILRHGRRVIGEFLEQLDGRFLPVRAAAGFIRAIGYYQAVTREAQAEALGVRRLETLLDEDVDGGS
jgi:hypothetical protein